MSMDSRSQLLPWNVGAVTVAGEALSSRTAASVVVGVCDRFVGVFAGGVCLCACEALSSRKANASVVVVGVHGRCSFVGVFRFVGGVLRRAFFSFGFMFSVSVTSSVLTSPGRLAALAACLRARFFICL